MSDTLSFFVAGEPVGQPRPRAKAMKRGKKVFAHVYNPDTADAWKALVRAVAKQAAAGMRFAGPVRVDLTFYMPRPKDHYRTNGQLKDWAPTHHVARPDVDNICKSTIDALTDTENYPGLWSDDSIVCGLSANKYYTFDGDELRPFRPGCAIEIRRKEPTQQPKENIP